MNCFFFGVAVLAHTLLALRGDEKRGQVQVIGLQDNEASTRHSASEPPSKCGNQDTVLPLGEELDHRFEKKFTEDAMQYVTSALFDELESRGLTEGSPEYEPSARNIIQAVLIGYNQQVLADMQKEEKYAINSDWGEAEKDRIRQITSKIITKGLELLAKEGRQRKTTELIEKEVEERREALDSKEAAKIGENILKAMALKALDEGMSTQMQDIPLADQQEGLAAFAKIADNPGMVAWEKSKGWETNASNQTGKAAASIREAKDLVEKTMNGKMDNGSIDKSKEGVRSHCRMSSVQSIYIWVLALYTSKKFIS